jgi:hypothetical protein
MVDPLLILAPGARGGGGLAKQFHLKR